MLKVPEHCGTDCSGRSRSPPVSGDTETPSERGPVSPPPSPAEPGGMSVRARWGRVRSGEVGWGRAQPSSPEPARVSCSDWWVWPRRGLSANQRPASVAKRALRPAAPWRSGGGTCAGCASPRPSCASARCRGAATALRSPCRTCGQAPAVCGCCRRTSPRWGPAAREPAGRACGRRSADSCVGLGLLLQPTGALTERRALSFLVLNSPEAESSLESFLLS